MTTPAPSRRAAPAPNSVARDNRARDNESPVIAVAGAASSGADRLLHYLENALPDCWFVTFDGRSLLRPAPRVSAYRLEISREADSSLLTSLRWTQDTAHPEYGGVISIADVPDVISDRAWDEVMVSHRITAADVADVMSMQGVDSLIYMGSHYDGPEAEQFLRATPYWMQAAQNARVRRFVYLSDYRVYGVRPDNPVPLTEQTPTRPLPAHRELLEAEPGTEDRAGAGDAGMSVATLRTAMVVGPGGSSPVARELLLPAIGSGKGAGKGGDRGKGQDREARLQFLHEYDLARAIVAAIEHNVDGVYNLAGGGLVALSDVMGFARTTQKGGRHAALQKEAGRARRSGGNIARHTMIASVAKFRQAARFRFRYSSEQAARAYCHSVLLEPDDPNRYA